MHEIADPVLRPQAHGIRDWRRWPVIRVVNVALPLVPRVVLASALLAVLVGAAFAVLVFAVSTLRGKTTQATLSKDVTAATLRLERDVIDLETSLRGFVITGDERFLKPWREARAALPASIAAVERLVSGNPAQARRVRRLSATIGAYVEDYAVPLVAIARLSPAAARTAIAATEGRRRLDPIRRQFARVLDVEDANAVRRVSSAKSQANRSIILGLAALGASVLLILLFGADLARGIAHPVRRAAEAATDVAAGDLSVRLPELGPGEIHNLAVAFNAMAQSLERGKRELELQNEQLRESERLRSELIGIVSHEVRTPLACVLGYTSLLLTRDFDEASRRRYLEIIGQEGRRLGSLIEEFLDVKRIEEGRLELREEIFDVRALVEQQVDSLAGRSDRHSIDLEAREGPFEVRGDRDRLAQVVANLLTNATKYSPAGGSIEVFVRRDGTVLRIGVQDHGIGIADEHRPRIFTKFFRGEARERGIAGAGLGLAISREIVEAHGGRMGFESAVGEGSLFWFELPPAQSS